MKKRPEPVTDFTLQERYDMLLALAGQHYGIHAFFGLTGLFLLWWSHQWMQSGGWVVGIILFLLGAAMLVYLIFLIIIAEKKRRNVVLQKELETIREKMESKAKHYPSKRSLRRLLDRGKTVVNGQTFEIVESYKGPNRLFFHPEKEQELPGQRSDNNTEQQ